MKYSVKPLTALFLLSVLCIIIMGFSKSPLIRKADRQFDKFNFNRASELYQKAYTKDPYSLEAKTKLADCYRLMNDMDQAELYYSYVVADTSADPINEFYYGQALRSNEKYEEAKPAFEAYSEKVPGDTRGIEIANGMGIIEELAKINPMYEVDLLSINSKSSEFSPAFYKDGIVFASNRNKSAIIRWFDIRTQNNFLDLYSAQKDESGEMQKPKLFKGKQPNGRYHEGPVAFNKNETEVYITRSNYTKNKEEKSENETVNLKIFKLETNIERDLLNNLVEAVPFNDKEYSVGHPTLTSDNQFMYFMSNMPGGYGGTDLYVSKRQGSSWGDPENLGSDINTASHEMFPFIDDEGTLFFASDGDVGLGGLDIYSTKKEKGKWSEVVNIGAPINSSMDDFGLIFDPEKREGYFTSNRQGGAGDDDIYHFVKNGITMRGIVYDAKTGNPVEGALVKLNEGQDQVISGDKGEFTFSIEPNSQLNFLASKDEYFPGKLNVDVGNESVFVKIPINKDEGIALEVTVQDKNTRKKLNLANVLLRNTKTGKEESCKTDNNGQCLFDLEENTRYEIVGWKDLPNPDQKYLKVNSSVNTIGKTSGAKLYALLELEFVEKGVAIKIDNIYYDLDKYFIRPDAAFELDKIVKILRDNPTMEIELSSHTDSRGSDSYNSTLSQNRAKSAVQYMTTRGITPTRMIAAGYGETKLVNRCSNGVKCSKPEHQENRRTEFKILKF